MHYASYLPMGMAHVERRELYENLGARLEYLKSFLEFGHGEVMYDFFVVHMLSYQRGHRSSPRLQTAYQIFDT